MSVIHRCAGWLGVVLSAAVALASSFSHGQSQPANASFESPTVAAGTRSAAPAGASWTFTGTAGIERYSPTSDFYGGGHTDSQVAYVSAAGTVASRGSIAQTISFPSVGYYVVRFAAGRSGQANGVQVSVGGVVVETEIIPRALGTTTNPQLESWWTVPFYVATAGAKEIKFAGTQPVNLVAGDVLWLDQVTISSVPVVLANSSFESSGSWTMGAGASITTSTKAGRVGSYLLRIPDAGGNALAAPQTFLAGKYSLSLRMARTYAGTTPCGVGVYRQSGGSFVQVTTIPGARSDSLVPYTSTAFDLPAGTYSLYFAGLCAGTSGSDWDSLVISSSGPSVGDPDFTQPDIGYPANADDRPLVYQPVGSPWTFTGPAGIQANPGAYVTNQPVTNQGHQYGFLDGTFARLDQPITLTAGTYVLVAQASNGLFKVNINGSPVSSISRGYSVANGSSANPGLDFGEVVSAPFTLATTGTVSLGVRGAGGSTGLQAVRVLRISTANSAPTVGLAMTLNGTPITAPVPAGVTVRATATASDSDGLSLLRVLRDGVALSPTSTTSPLVVDVTLSTPGATHSFVAEATDTLGAIGTASQSVSVLANAAPVISSFTVSPATPQAAAIPLTLAATASDTDAYVSTIDFYWRNLNSTNPAQYIAGQSCVNSSSSPLQPFTCNNKTWTPPAGTGGNYALTARATDNNGAASTSSEVAVSVCGPKVTLNSPTTSNIGAPPLQNASVAVSITAGQFSSNTACGALSLVEVLVNGASTTIAPPPSGLTYTTTLSLPASPTPYSIAARVTETTPGPGGSSRVVQSNAVAVTITTNSPPVVTSIASIGTGGLIAGQSGTIRAAATDTGGSISSIAMTVTPAAGGSSSTASCSNLSSCDLTFTPGAAGLYAVNVTVTDNGGASVSSNTTVAVSAAPSVPEIQAPTTANIGTTAGQFAVSESGAATYSIPITVAPGVNGIQPSLALTYNSQGGDGHLGVGWGLSGLSSITRCPKTIATDGVREPINYDNVTDPFTGNDAFCLDGQRLVPVSGGLTSVSCVWPPQSSSAPNNTCAAWEFRTELDSYSRIVGIGDNSAVGTTGSGPTRFRIYTKSGQILEYGSRWWGIAAPRPDPQTSLITNPSFEDTVVTDPGTNPNIAYGESYGLPTSWGYFLTNSQANSQGWFFDGGTDSTYAPYSGAGVQRDGSAWSQSGPTSASVGAGVQNAFIQRRGRLYAQPYLEAGLYTLSFRLAGRGTSGVNFGGNQTVRVVIDGVAQGSFDTTTGQGFSKRSLQVQVNGSGTHLFAFEGMRNDDQTALLDDIKLVPLNSDIYSVKVFPLDRVEDRSGNYMHVDYGGTHETQYLINPDGTVTPTNGTLLSSYGTAEFQSALPVAGRIGLVAQGARPALEIFPRRLTYGMRAANPGAGTNRQSVGGVEIARVILNYETRPDVSKLYDTGSGQMLISKRLASIWALVGGDDDTSLPSDRENFHQNEILGNNQYGSQCTTGAQASCGTLVRKYTMAYSQSPSTQRSRLNSVTECSADGLCLPSTNFAWQESVIKLNANPLPGFQPKDDGTDWNDLITNARVADIVGDGRSRFVRRIGDGQAIVVCTFGGSRFDCTPPPPAPTPSAPDTWRLPANIDSNYQFPYEIPDRGVNQSWFLADLNGDGIADLVATTDQGKAFGCLSTGVGWGTCANIAPSQSGTRYYSKTGDFDGDGRMDVAFYRGNGQFEVCRAVGGENPRTPWSWVCNAPTTIQGFPIGFQNAADELDHLMIADFDGDGRADIAYRTADACVVGAYNVIPPLPQTQCKTTTGQPVYPTTSDSYWSVCFSRGKSDAISFQCATHSGGGISGAVKSVKGKPSLLATYDFNGDGLADMATYVASSGGWRVCLSTADGEFARKTDGTGDCPIWLGPTETAEKTAAGDFNGDGRTDLVYFANGVWRICVSTGSSFALGPDGQCPVYASHAAAPAIMDNQAQIFVGDYNGDGKSDVAVNGLNTNGTLSYGFSESVMPDLLASVTTGLGATTAVRYRALSSADSSSSSFYTKALGDIDAKPILDNEIVIQSPMYVVESTLASTATTGKFFKSSYRYEGLRADKWGRGLYGFYRRSITDNVVADATGAVLDNSNLQVTTIRTSQAWPNVGRPEVVSKVAGGTVVSTTAMTYAGWSTATGIARTNGVGGQYQRWEAFQTLTVQNPRFGRLTNCPTATFPNGLVSDLGGTLTETASGSCAFTNSRPLPTVVTYTGVVPSADLNANPILSDAAAAAAFVSARAQFYDSFGNPKKVITRTLHPNTGELWTQTVENTYFNEAEGGGDTSRWLLGKLKTATTTSEVGGGYVTNGDTTVVRKSQFNYQGYGGNCSGARDGQLCSEIVQPDEATAGNRTLFQKTDYEYDDFGNRTKSTVSFFEDALGATSKSRASTTTYQFGKYPLVTTRIGDGINLSDSRAYTDNRCRLATKVTDANGNYATTDYDGFCRKVRESAYTNDGKLAKQTTFTLVSVNSNGEVYALETRSADIQHPDKRTAIQYYDNLQRVVRAQARRFDGDPTQTSNAAQFATAHTYFDALGRHRCVAKEVSGSTQAAAQPCAGQTWTITAGSAITRFDYDAMNRVVTETAPDNAVISTTYNGLSTTVSRTNPGGTAGANNSSASHLVTKTANARGLVATVVTSPIATTVTNAYDAMGNLTRVSTVGGPTSVALVKTMAYDVRGRQKRLSDPDAGEYNYGYNGVGEQVSQTDGAFTTTTIYDNFGRKQSRSEVGGGTTIWTYDCTNAKGLLCSVSYSGAGGSASGYTKKETGYDAYARPTTTTTEIDKKSFVSQVAYDAYGRPQYAVYPQATAATAPLVTRTSYSTLGFAYKVDNPSNTYVYQEIKARNADGQLAQANLGGLITLNHGYASDGLARISRINVSSGTSAAMPVNFGTGLLDQSFEFESIGNLKGRKLKASTANPARDETEAFGYDALDRLISSTGVNDSDTGSFGYDDAGNITNKGGLTLAYGAGGLAAGNGALGGNRLCGIGVSACAAVNSPGAIDYDSRGNILRYTRPTGGASGADGATITLSGYTAFNLPTLIQKAGTSNNASASFAYDAGYQRVRQIKYGASGTQVDDILYVVPGGFEVHRNDSGQVLQSIATISGAEGVIATVTTYFDPNTGLPITGAGQGGNTANLSGSTTVTKLLIKDHLGSMVAEVIVVGTSGAPTLAGSIQIHGFGPWGNARNLAARFAEGDRGFTGHEHLTDLGIIHMNGRLYDPVLGRFMQADPIIQAPHNAQSHNRYSYVLNNPLSFTDPSGFSAWTKWRSTVFAIAAAVIVPFAAGELFMLMAQGGNMTFATIGYAEVIGLNGAGQAAAAIAGGFAAGGIAGGNIQSALQGAFTAGLTFGLASGFGLHGAAAFGTGKHLGQMALHAAMGCAQSAMAGGSCKSGAISGGVSAFASPLLPPDRIGRLVGSSAIGAIASRLSGGKAENGALTAAFSYLFNEGADRLVDKANASNPWRVFKQAMMDFWDSGKYNASIGVGAQFNIAGGAAGDVGLTFNVDPSQSGYRAVDDVCVYANRCVSFGPVVGGAMGIVGQLQTGHSSTGTQSQGGIFFVGGSGIVGEGQVQIGEDGNTSAGRGLVGVGVMFGGAMASCRVSYYCGSTAIDWLKKKD